MITTFHLSNTLTRSLAPSRPLCLSPSVWMSFVASNVSIIFTNSSLLYRRCEAYSIQSLQLSLPPFTPLKPEYFHFITIKLTYCQLLLGMNACRSHHIVYITLFHSMDYGQFVWICKCNEKIKTHSRCCYNRQKIETVAEEIKIEKESFGSTFHFFFFK